MIETEGFLSPGLDGSTEQIRNEFAELIEQFRKESAKATGGLFASRAEASSLPIAMAMSFWTRCVTTCQAAFLLGERGMGVEAMVLLRTAYEHLFFCGALIARPDILPRIEGEDRKQRHRQIEAMLRSKQILEAMTPALKAELEEYVRDTPKPTKEISAYEAADLAGMEGVFSGAYRTLSMVGSHASFTTAGHAFGESLSELQFGPSRDHLEMVFGLARYCLTLGMEVVDKVLHGRGSEAAG